MTNDKIRQNSEGLSCGENSAKFQLGVHPLHRVKFSWVGMIEQGKDAV